MKVDVPLGKYVIAVSGGVDSMVLLDVLKQDPGLELIVAHFNHGIRPDSIEDEALVAKTAKKHNIPFEAGYGNLGGGASEEQAREARYNFLESIKAKHSTDGIITAHHQGDLIETAFMNILRGSGYRGLVAMQSNSNIVRPLLQTSKVDLINYAKKHKIQWREDATNQDKKYLRNYIRSMIIPAISDKQHENIINEIEKVASKVEEKEKLIATISQLILEDGKIARSKYIVMPPEIRNELVMYWLRQNKVTEFDRKTVERLDIILKTGAGGSNYPVKKGVWLRLDDNTAEFDSQA